MSDDPLIYPVAAEPIQFGARVRVNGGSVRNAEGVSANGTAERPSFTGNRDRYETGQVCRIRPDERDKHV